MAARPSPPPLRRNSWIIVPTMRPPLAPIGWPSATAPPFTFTIASSAPSMRVELRATDENASLISTRFTASIDAPAFSNARCPARAGVRARYAKSSATYACATIVASTSSPRRFANSSDVTITHDLRVLLHHVQLVERGRESVEDHRVDQLAVPDPIAEARLLQEIGRVRHRLHPAGDHALVLAGADHRVGDLDRADGRRAHLVD